QSGFGLNERPERDGVRFEVRLTRLAHRQRATADGRQGADAGEEPGVVQVVRLDEEAELLGGLERACAAGTAAQLGHGVLVAQAGTGAEAPAGWVGELGAERVLVTYLTPPRSQSFAGDCTDFADARPVQCGPPLRGGAL